MTNVDIIANSCPTLSTIIQFAEAAPGFAEAAPDPQSASGAMVKFRALGPVEAVVAGQLADLGAPKQRALLALLVSRVGEPVAVDVMLEELWAGQPPPSAMTSLQAYVANLRRVLEPDRAPRTPATVLRTHNRGYLLNSRVVEVDVHRFGEHATAGWQAWERGEPRQALTEFEAGLSLWRGQAYAEMADATYVVPEVARLEELRLSVAEGRCAALLAVGAHELAVAELEAFTQAYPLREYGCELLSLALYRAGRQADALAVLRTNRQRLAEELGIDPRPALTQLEHQILNQATALDWQPASAAEPRSSKDLRPPAESGDLPPHDVTEVHKGWLLTIPIERDEIRDVSGKAVLPPGYEDAGAVLTKHRVVVLADEPGAGRRTAALALLERHCGGSLRFCRIETDGDRPTVARLPLHHRHAFLLDLNDEETDVPDEEFGRALRTEHAARLQAAQSYLVITVTPQIWTACAGTEDITVCPGRPDSRAVCERHLRVAGDLDDRIPWLDMPGIKDLLKPGSRPSDMARLAFEIATAPDTDSGRREVVNKHTNWRGAVHELFAKNPTPADRAFAVAAAALDNSPAYLVLEAADTLLEKLGGSVPAASALAGEPLSKRLEKINADPDNDVVCVSGKQRDLDHAILLHVWDQWPRCRGALLNWLADPLPPGTQHQRTIYAKLANVMFRLAAEREPAPVMEALRQWWTRPERREHVVGIISAALTHHRIGDQVRHRLYGWAKQSGDSDLAYTIADILAGKQHGIALTRLKHLAAVEDQAVSGTVE